VREENRMPLLLAISKISYIPAYFMEENGVPQMADKGRIQEGKDAFPGQPIRNSVQN